MKKHVLTDVDDVLLNYGHGLLKYINREKNLSLNDNTDSLKREYTSLKDYVSRYANVDILEIISSFNSSEEFSKLSAFKDSKKYIKQLYDNGYTFTAITAAGRSAKTQEYRRKNLNKVFDGMISDVYFVNLEETKYKYLEMFKNSGFIYVDDNIKNYMTAEFLGLEPVLFQTKFNFNDKKDITEVKNWKEVYYKIQNWYE